VSGLLSVSEIRGFVPTDLSDASIQLLLDDALSEIDLRCGDRESQVDTLDGSAGRWIFPARAIESVTSIKERYRRYDDEITLAEDDYSIHDNGKSLLRELDGTNPRIGGWGVIVTVAYTPKDDLARRKRAQRDLVRIAIQHEGVSQQKAGNFSVSHVDYERERSRILRRLKSSNRRLLA